MKSPFHLKDYKSYDDYIAHQCSKLDIKLSNPNGVAWLDRHERTYYSILKYILDALCLRGATSIFKGKTCLCLGARGEAEVRAFISMGCLAIGIDVKPTPNNSYVVMGDAARIQYEDDSFDIVFTNAFDHFLAINDVLAQISRVLKPNGLFILITGTPEGAKGDDFGSTYWDSQDELEEYLLKAYKFKVMARTSIEKDTKGWFSHVVIFRNKKEGE